MDRRLRRPLDGSDRQGASSLRGGPAIKSAITETRNRLGWTLEELAEHAEMHWTYVGSVERGERNLSLIHIVRLARALGIGPEELVRRLRP